MRCFYHGDVDAVAICKSCGHALCRECCAEVGGISACRNRCENDVEALNDVNQRNRSVYQKTSGAYKLFAAFFFGVSLFMAISGYGALHSEKPSESIGTFVFAGFFFLMGVGVWVFARRFRSK
jgi:hypothetical protein